MINGITKSTIPETGIPIWLIIVLIFINNDAFFFAFNSDSINSIPRYMAILICAILFLRAVVRKKRISIGLLAPYLTVVFFVIVSSYRNNDFINRTLATIVFVTEGMLLAWNYSFHDIFKKYEKVMYFLAISSIVIWIIAELVPDIIRAFPLVSPNSARIYNLFIGGVFDQFFLSGRLIRSNSIFWEAGVFQIYLNIALAYNLIVKQKIDVKKSIIYVIAILLTFSTASVVITSLLFGIYIFFKKADGDEKNKKTKFAFFIISIVSVVVLYIGVDAVFATYFTKVQQKGHGSTAMRLGSLAIGGYLTFNHPLFGIGASRLGEMFKYYMLEFGYVQFAFTYSFTNTIMYYSAVYGAIVGTVFVAGTYKVTRYYSDSVFFRMAIFMFFFLLYVDESLNSSVWPWIIVFLGWNYRIGSNSELISAKEGDL